MPAENKVQIVVEVDAKTGRATIRQLGEEMTTVGRKGQQGFGQAASGADRLGTSLRPVIGLAQQLGLALGAAGALKLAKDLALSAARYETLGVVLGVVENNAGYTRAEMDGFTESLQKNGIAMTESRAVLTRMAQANIDLSKSSELARIAQNAGVIGNINSSEAFERMVHGIQSGQIEVLRTIGINVNFENSYKKLAAQLGKNTADLTENEKMQARVNVVMQAGTGIAGSYEAAMDTAGKKVTSLPRYFDDLKVSMGEAFSPLLKQGVDDITDSLKDMVAWFKDEQNKQAVVDWGNNALTTFESVQAEIIRIGMLIDKTGGSLSFVASLPSAIPAALGVKSSQGRMQRMAGYNIMFEERYAEKDRMLEDLAKRQIARENSFSPAGLAATKAAQEGLEKKRMAAGSAARASAEAEEKAASALKKSQADSKTAAREADAYLKKRLAYMEDLGKARQAWEGKAELAGLTDLDRQLAAIAQNADELRDKFGDAAWIGLGQTEQENAARQAARLKTQKDDQAKLLKVTESYNEALIAGLDEQGQALARLKSQYDTHRQAVVAWGEAQIDAGNDAAEVMGRVFFALDQLDARQAVAAEELKWRTGELSEFQIQAFRNMESAAGTFFFDVMQGRFDNFFDGFVTMLQKMVAEWTAAQAMMGLFGKDFSKGGPMGGLLGTAASAIGAYFGSTGGITSAAAPGTSYVGSYDAMTGAQGAFSMGGPDTYTGPSYLLAGGRADGGPVSPGKMYEVNERGIPELLFTGGKQYLLMGQDSGTVVPAGDRGPAFAPAPSFSTPASTSAPAPAQISITIIAADAQSITDMMRRNPQAILGPFRDALQKGDRGLRSDLQKVM